LNRSNIDTGCPLGKNLGLNMVEAVKHKSEGLSDSHSRRDDDNEQ